MSASQRSRGVSISFSVLSAAEATSPVARGSLWVRCCPGGTRCLCLQGRLDGWADLVLRGAGVFWVNIWCKTKTQAANTGQPSGGDPIVSPLTLSRHKKGELLLLLLCVPQPHRVLLLSPEGLTRSQGRFTGLPVERWLWTQAKPNTGWLKKRIFTLHMCQIGVQSVSSQGPYSSLLLRTTCLWNTLSLKLAN